ncbi:feruloyl CoA ortho-hydroxylase 1-like [Heracleum sosnowskyi]|uniref:feruloyl-CoA 6-hydroxylase n=1 Tax=Heracleum sosnowskyi TaxID=360622 RepID=A0AAD8MM37_9APIA|nr:feruloyl CoA ortho-hydroxylase 1-like [Heracleum sosnowskyi]
MAPSPTNDYRNFAVTKGHGVKGLSDLKLDALPEQYIQPVEERLDMTKVLKKESIPVIDMSNLDDPNVAHQIAAAAEKWGFFQIINHGVPIEVLENVKEATRRFFALPVEEKIKYTQEQSPTNSVRLTTSFLPKVDKVLEWKDYLSILVSDEKSSEFWPSTCKNDVKEYVEKSEFVMKWLLKALMKGLNVDMDSKESILMGSTRINLNYYPVCPNPELAIGVGRHSDVSTLTFLLQDNVGGLHIRKMDTDTWIFVPPVEGAIVINIGDALQILSNGKYKSAEHCVAANGNNDRISVPIFTNPSPDDIIGPLPELLKNGEKPIYKHVLYSDYVKHFYRKSHDGKHTLDFAEM